MGSLRPKENCLSKLVSLAICVGMTAMAALSSASYSAYVIAKGTKQGQFRGAGRSKTGHIPVLRFVMSDSKGAQGRSQPTEIMIDIEGLDEEQFKQAFVNNEVLATVEIDVVQASGIGVSKVDQKVKLTNASVKSLVETYSNGGAPVTSITFTYQTLELTIDGHSVMSDSNWRS